MGTQRLGNPVAPRDQSGSSANSALADALFRSTQQRVLALLFGQPNREFFVTQIIDLVGSGRGSVQREIARLAESGLVIVSRVGNRKHYRANPKSPIFEELCGIVRKTVGLEESIRAALEPLASKLKLALIYGSVARRTDTASSDIDLLLVSEQLTLRPVFVALEPVEISLARRVSPKVYRPHEFRQRRMDKEGFLARVLGSPHVILMGSLDAA